MTHSRIFLRVTTSASCIDAFEHQFLFSRVQARIVTKSWTTPETPVARPAVSPRYRIGYIWPLVIYRWDFGHDRFLKNRSVKQDCTLETNALARGDVHILLALPLVGN